MHIQADQSAPLAQRADTLRRGRLEVALAGCCQACSTEGAVRSGMAAVDALTGHTPCLGSSEVDGLIIYICIFRCHCQSSPYSCATLHSDHVQQTPPSCPRPAGAPVRREPPACCCSTCPAHPPPRHLIALIIQPSTAAQHHTSHHVVHRVRTQVCALPGHGRAAPVRRQQLASWANTSSQAGIAFAVCLPRPPIYTTRTNMH